MNPASHVLSLQPKTPAHSYVMWWSSGVSESERVMDGRAKTTGTGDSRSAV